jgi:hypothetical protein
MHFYRFNGGISNRVTRHRSGHLDVLSCELHRLRLGFEHTPWLVRPANTDTAIKVSAVLAVLWGALILFAFTKFRNRALWFLLGTPVIVFWFFVLFLGICPQYQGLSLILLEGNV